MTEYRIAAIPTEYKGRMYRSRLEAKWAAYFGFLGFEVEYEPFDLGTWSPDFLITRGRWSVLVEVKPVTEFCEETAAKMLAASTEKGLQDSVSALLLVGVSPTRKPDWMGNVYPVSVGWGCAFYYLDVQVQESAPSWEPAHLMWGVTPETPGLQADIMLGEIRGGSATSATILGSDVPDNFIISAYPNHAMKVWASATNAVQWRPQGGRA